MRLRIQSNLVDNSRQADHKKNQAEFLCAERMIADDLKNKITGEKLWELTIMNSVKTMEEIAVDSMRNKRVLPLLTAVDENSVSHDTITFHISEEESEKLAKNAMSVPRTNTGRLVPKKRALAIMGPRR